MGHAAPTKQNLVPAPKIPKLVALLALLLVLNLYLQSSKTVREGLFSLIEVRPTHT